ncbi:unnamed protein product [Rhodiola kirilowii]
MAPPETRANAADTATMASIHQSLKELNTRTVTVEEMVHNQSLVNERTSSSIERIFDVLEKLQADRMTEREAEKQPIQGTQTPATVDPSPLLPTPRTPPIHQLFLNNTPPSQVSNNNEQTEPALKLPRIDVPIFKGEAVTGWAFQMDRYFEHQGIPIEQKMIVAPFYLGGEALE